MYKNGLTQKVLFAAILAAITLLIPVTSEATMKKGLLIYDSNYGSTPEVAYWIKAIIGVEQPLDVKKIDQVITVAPYDYVIIGSSTKNEKPLPRIYKFVEANKDELAKKEVRISLSAATGMKPWCSMCRAKSRI